MCSFAADPPPYIDGIRINSPHYLTKIKLTTPGTHTFTLVVSQYEKQNTIHYTVRVSQRMVARCNSSHSSDCSGRGTLKKNPLYFSTEVLETCHGNIELGFILLQEVWIQLFHNIHCP